MNTPVALQNSWKQLQAASPPAQVLGALEHLVANRQAIGRFSAENVQVLVELLVQPPGQHAEDIQACALALLARWARQLSATYAVHRGQPGTGPAGASAAPNPGREEYCAAVCHVLQHHRMQWSVRQQWQEVVAGVGHLMAALQGHGGAVMWLLASVLTLWSPLASPFPLSSSLLASNASIIISVGKAVAPQLDDMLPLFPAMRQVGQAMLQGTNLSTASQQGAALGEVFAAALEAPLMQERAAAVLAAGGLLAGLSRGPAQLPEGDACLAQLDMLLTHACHQADATAQQNSTAAGDHQQFELAGLWRDAAAAACMETFQVCRRPQPTSLDAQEAAQDSVQLWAIGLHNAYRDYALGTAPAWLGAVDSAAVRQVLDKVFMAAVLLLTSFWEAATAAPARQRDLHTRGSLQRSNESPLLAVKILYTLAHLHFCRMRLSAVSVLLKSVLAAVADDVQASEALLLRLPCYADCIAPSSVASGQATWAVDAVLATRVHFLMGMLVPCIACLPQGRAVELAIPLVLLYLLYPQAPVATAAHNLFCAILQHAQQKEELVPLYIRRSLDGYPQVTPIAGLAELLREDAGSKAGLNLLRILAGALLHIDYQLLPDARELVASVVLSAPAPTRPEACAIVHDVVVSSDSYTSKVSTARWFQRLAAACERGAGPALHDMAA
ncbi:hypothetical protein WJX72_005867 [[Myrmecia] bisecta]|uniref:Uncharacterized protein n=1 Tax=[Myrmecia] bisecta TaxID=41462 RepID=A0AAW1R749_9CHLO